jgi:hypothetical protein
MKNVPLSIQKVRNTPDGQALFTGIAGNFQRFSQPLCEFIDDSVSNYRAHKPRRNSIEIALFDHRQTVEVVLRDYGTGIRDLDAAMTIADRSGAETLLNEHGFGLKHALSSVAGNQPGAWRIETRTKEDAARGRYKSLQAPYDIGMDWVTVTGQGAIPGETGTVIRFFCPYRKFATLKPPTKRGEAAFPELVEYLKEELRYTYASLLEKGQVSFDLTWTTGKGKTGTAWLAEPLAPTWEKVRTLPTVETDLGGGPVTIRCLYGSIVPDKENALYYKGNMATSGVELRVDGRVIQHGLYSAIWNKALHPDQNRFLAQIDLSSTVPGALPATRSAKNGFVEDDQRLLALYCWIRSNVEEPPKAEKAERRLVRQLAAKKAAEPGVLRVSQEETVYQCIGLKTRVDLFVSSHDGVTLYEAKAKGSRAQDVYQLRMYYDGSVSDGKPVDTAILIAHHHPKEVKALIEELNRQKDPTGKPYHFAMTTWAEEGVALPTEAA